MIRRDIVLPEVRSQGVMRRCEKLAFTVDGVLTEEECGDLIADTEARGYEEALVNVGAGRQQRMEEYRNSQRCIVDSEDTAAWIWARIKDRASNEGSRKFHNHGEGPYCTSAFSWLKVPTHTFTF